jgi:hypothetical protein
MALTSEDLNQIKNIVEGSETRLRQEIKDSESRLRQDLDRMEGRLVTSINLLQRDTFSRLDNHDSRIERLEKAVAK